MVYEASPTNVPISRHFLLSGNRWVNGSPIFNLIGLLELYSEELGEADATSLVSRWVLNLCDALKELHSAGLVHGDVSTKNILESGGNVSLVDYDLVLLAGEPVWCVGTPTYAPPELTIGSPAQFSQDIFSLAASIFHVLFDREPFRRGGNIRHELGLNWDGVDRDKWGWIPTFFGPGNQFFVCQAFRECI
jgi:serine/threonine protein kinase